MKTVFVPREQETGERRVAAVPATVKKLRQAGFRVLVESGAGAESLVSDSEYDVAGAELVGTLGEGFRDADIVLMLNAPSLEQAAEFREGCSLVSFLYPQESEELIEKLCERNVTAFSINSIPRITRAQKYDALSSQNNLAGYRAVILAALESPKIFPLLMTAAGTLRPARVVVLGAGVAGLQAIATAKRLGAVVEVSDVRPSVKEQVESLGGQFIEIPTEQSMELESGYAKEQTKEFLVKQQQITAQRIIAADAVITTALIPGRPAPCLIDEDVVKSMRDGSVIVDLAAPAGGNCALTELGEKVIRHGVSILGPVNLAAELPVHASEAYSRNVANVILDQVSKEKVFNWDLEDEVVSAALITHEGKRWNPEQEVVEKTESSSQIGTNGTQSTSVRSVEAGT